MKSKEKIFFPNLDGLRFIAFFAVFFHHTVIVKCFATNEQSGWFKWLNQQKENGALGVNLFFVLSGFLITYLLLKEKEAFGKIHILQFYVRRILRIWPLYFAMVVLGFLIFPLVKSAFGDVSNETHNPLFYVLFISNFEMITKGFADSSILNVLWSVGVEEQFYLIWPLFLFIIPNKYFLQCFGILILGTFLFRYFNNSNGTVIYYHTAAVFSDMVIGGVAAYCSFTSKKFMYILNKMPRKYIIATYVFFSALILFRHLVFQHSFAIVFERFVLSLFFGFIILEQNFAENSFYKIGNSKWLSKWGNYTYGLYCLHPAALLVSHILSEKILNLNNNLWAIMIIDFTIGLLITMVAAYCSFHYFEKRFLKLKDKFAYFVR